MQNQWWFPVPACIRNIADELLVSFIQDNMQRLGCTLECRFLQNYKPSNLNHITAVVTQKMSSWGNAILSLAHRVTLINSMLLALLVYPLSDTWLPTSIVNEVEKLIGNFMRGSTNNKKHIQWSVWHKIRMPKTIWGLGCKDLRTGCSALLAKHAVRFEIDEQSI